MRTIILHGWGQNSKIWNAQIQKLGKNSVAIDLPGFGDELYLGDNWGIPEYADWIEHKLNKYNDVVLIGHSFGGRVTAEVASKQPKWLKGVVLVGAPCIYRPSTSTKAKIRFYKLLKNFLPKRLRNSFLSNDLKESQKYGLENVFRKVISYDQTKQLKNITIPSLLVWGKDDDQVPVSIAFEMCSLIKHSEIKVIEHAGHNVALDKPDLFFGLVNNFIKKIQ